MFSMPQRHRLSLSRIITIAILLNGFCVMARDSNDAITEARSLLKQGEKRKALLVLKRVMRKKTDPKRNEAQVLYFTTVLEQNDSNHSAEVKNLETALTEQERGFSKGQLAELLSQAYVRADEFKRAVGLLEPLASDSTYPFQQITVLIALGKVYTDWKKKAEAAQCFKQALTVLSHLSKSQREEAGKRGIGEGAIRALLRGLRTPKSESPQALAKQYEAAVKNYYAGSYDPADKTFTEIMSKHAGSKFFVGSRFYNAATRYQKADYANAIKRLEALLKDQPSGQFAGMAHRICGDVAMEHTFDFTAAETHYFQALKLLKGNEADASVYFRLGILMHSKRKYDEASKYYLKEISLVPRKKDDFNLPNHTRFLVDMCKRQESPMPVERKLGRLNCPVRNLLFIASAYLESRKCKEALRLLKLVQSKAYKPKATNEQRAYAILEEGECYHMQMQAERALERFSVVVKTFPTSGSAPIALFEMARIHLGSGDFAKGEECLKQIISKYGTSNYKVKACYNLAFSYYCREAYDDAVRLYRSIKQKYPKSWEAGKSDVMINLIKSKVEQTLEERK